MLDEVNVSLVFSLAGYNIKNMDRQEIVAMVGQYLKAYMTNKDIGIIGPVSLIINEVKNKE